MNIGGRRRVVLSQVNVKVSEAMTWVALELCMEGRTVWYHCSLKRTATGGAKDTIAGLMARGADQRVLRRLRPVGQSNRQLPSGTRTCGSVLRHKSRHPG